MLFSPAWYLKSRLQSTRIVKQRRTRPPADHGNQRLRECRSRVPPNTSLSPRFLRFWDINTAYVPSIYRGVSYTLRYVPVFVVNRRANGFDTRIAIATSSARSLSLFSTRRPPTPSGWGFASFPYILRQTIRPGALMVVVERSLPYPSTAVPTPTLGRLVSAS